MGQKAGVGAKVNHPRYGEGVIFGLDGEFFRVYFKGEGEKEIGITYDSWEVLEAGSGDGDGFSLEQVEEALINVLERYADFTPMIPLGDKWLKGTLILKPYDSSLQPKEVPIDTFFHKIVMVRDRIRVMEQQINSNSKLSDEEKVNLQQYITRIYGSLTTFNVLFKRKEDYFRGEGGKDS